MDKYIKLQKYTDSFLTHHNIKMNTKDKYKIVKQVAMYLDAVIFNIISIFCLISILNDSTKITEKTLNVGKKYIETTCSFDYKMSGGNSVGSPAFMGKLEPMYSASNPTSDFLRVDFQNGSARPQIGGSHTGLNTIIAKYVKDILLYHNVTTNQKIKKELTSIINFHLDCFIGCLKNHQGALTVSALNKIVKEHKVLHPLK
jgi:hypothetical protein